MSRLNFIAHDFETTGVNAKTCGVVQSAIAIVSIDIFGNWEIEAEEVAYHHPGCPIPAGAAAVHGITDERVKGLPDYEESLPETYAEAMKYNPQGVIGYNSNRFDNVIAKRVGMPDLMGLDMMVAANRMMSRGHITRARLVDAYEQLTGNEPTNAHDAMADVKMTLELIKPVMKIMEFEGFPDFVGWLTTPEANPKLKMPFGKHKGSPLEIIPKSYLQWLANKEDLQEELALSVRAALNGH